MELMPLPVAPTSGDFTRVIIPLDRSEPWFIWSNSVLSDAGLSSGDRKSDRACDRCLSPRIRTSLSNTRYLGAGPSLGAKINLLDLAVPTEKRRSTRLYNAGNLIATGATIPSLTTINIKLALEVTEISVSMAKVP